MSDLKRWNYVYQYDLNHYGFQEDPQGTWVRYADIPAVSDDALTAERDQLREALEQFLIEYDEVDLAHAEPSSLTEAVLEARAALKGEA